MTDWADEIAADLDHEAFSCGGGGDYPVCSVNHEIIATALRKAKADGMKEAAEIFENEEHWGDTTLALVRAAASKLHPTE